MQQLVKLYEQGEIVGPWKYQDGVLYFKNRIYLLADSSLVTAILSEVHSSTHEGYHKTLQRVRSVFYWVRMRKKIKEFIRQCDTCQRKKAESVALAGLLHPLPIPSQV